MKKLFISLVFIAFVFSGCGGPDLKEGFIKEKGHDEASTTVVFIPICTGGKYTTCTLIPYFIYDDEDWFFKIEKCDENNKCEKGTVYVNEETWNQYTVDQYFGPDSNAETSDPNKKTEKT